MIAWGFDVGVAHVPEIGVTPPRPPKKKYPDADDIGGFRSIGKTNSSRAKRKARLTRIKNERERSAAALAEARARRDYGCSAEHKRDVEAMLDAVGRAAPMTSDLRRRLASYMRQNSQIRINALTDTTDNDYRDKIVRPAYLTRSKP